MVALDRKKRAERAGPEKDVIVGPFYEGDLQGLSSSIE